MLIYITIMYQWLKIASWLRNIIVAGGLIWGYALFSDWQAAGKNYDLMENTSFVIAFCLVAIPFVTVGLAKQMALDKMNKIAKEGKNLLDSGKYEVAIENFDKAISIKDTIVNRVLPEEMIFHLHRAKALLKLDKNEEALADLRRIVRIDKEHAAWKKLTREANDLIKTLE